MDSSNGSIFWVWKVSPFGNLRILRLFAPPRSLSQLVTSFVGSQCQGIPLVLFLAWTSSNDLLMFSTSIWSFVLAWVSQIGYFYRSIVFFFTLILERPFYLLLDLKKLFLSKLKSYICLIFDLLFSYSLVNVHTCASRSFLSTIKYPSMHLNHFKYIHQYLICGGPEWARTTDLALIRRTL